MPALADRYNPPIPVEALGLTPKGKVSGEARVPGSKSEAQRVLVCAGLARGTTRVRGLPDGEDVAAALALLEASGVEVERAVRDARADHEAVVRSGGSLVAVGPVSVGESGTLARLATAVFALTPPFGRITEIRAEGTLGRRKSAPLFRALGKQRIAFLGEAGGWPVRATAVEPGPEIELVDPVSSQEASALLVALAASARGTRLAIRGAVPSAPYVRMTERVLERFGAPGRLSPPADPIDVEPDASSAAVVLAAACLSGGSVLVPGLGPDSLQGDVRIVEHLAAFGCDAVSDARGLRAEGAPSRGAELDLAGEPDLAPVLAAIAAAAAIRAGARSRLRGLATLRRKESDRLDVLAKGLAAVGLSPRVDADALEIAPGRLRGERVRLDPAGDHRMAFAFALLGLVAEGVEVADAGCVAKSWPSFWDDLERLGAGLHRARA